MSMSAVLAYGYDLGRQPEHVYNGLHEIAKKYPDIFVQHYGDQYSDDDCGIMVALTATDVTSWSMSTVEFTNVPDADKILAEAMEKILLEFNEWLENEMEDPVVFDLGNPAWRLIVAR